MPTVGNLLINLGVNMAPLTRGLGAGATAVKQFTGQLTSSARGIATISSGVIGAHAAMAGFAGAVETVKWGVSLAADAEQAKIAFEVMLKSGEQAKALLAGLQTYADKTPFEMPELRDAAKSLLGFGFAGNDVIRTLKMLGDLSAGLNVPIGELAEIFGKARVQGRAFSRDIHELTNRGIPIIQALAKQFGVAESEVMSMVEAGKVGFPEISKAMYSMTEAGGQFFGMVDKQSGSLKGLYSTLHDNYAGIVRDFSELAIKGTDAGTVLGELAAGMQAYKKEFEDTGKIDSFWDAVKGGASHALGMGDWFGGPRYRKMGLDAEPLDPLKGARIEMQHYRDYHEGKFDRQDFLGENQGVSGETLDQLLPAKDWFEQMKKAEEEQAKALAKLKEKADPAAAAVERAAAEQKAFEAATEGASEETVAAMQAQRDRIKALRDEEAALKKATAEAQKKAAAEKKAIAEANKEADELEEMFADVEKHNKEFTENQVRDAKESIKSPYEKMMDDVTKLRGLFDEGSIDQDTFLRAMGKTQAEFMEAATPEHHQQGALAQGSSEAASAIIAASTNKTDFGSLVDQQLGIAKQELFYLRRLYEQSQANKPKPPNQII